MHWGLYTGGSWGSNGRHTTAWARVLVFFSTGESGLCEEAELQLFCKKGQPAFVPRCRLARGETFHTRVTQEGQQRGQSYCAAFSASSQSWNQLAAKVRFSQVWKTLCGAVWMGNDALTPYISKTGTDFSAQKKEKIKKKGRRWFVWGESYLVIIPPLFWLNDKGPHIRNGHLYRALARGLILHDQVRRRGGGGAHLDLRLRGGGRGERL